MVNCMQDVDLRETLPKPKVRPADRAGTARWLRYHAAFSLSFAKAALTFLEPGEDSLVLDPFLGSGTTCVAAKQMRIPSVGLEINPIAYYTSRAKLCWQLDPKRVSELTSKLIHLSAEKPDLSESYSSAFGADDQTLERSSTIGHYLIANLSGDERDFFIATLLLTLRKIISLKKGLSISFLTWTPKGYKVPATDARAFSEFFQSQANSMLRDLINLRAHNPNPNTPATILFQSALELKYPRKFDAIVTSPPYLSRLDYILSYRIENELIMSLGYPYPRRVCGSSGRR